MLSEQAVSPRTSTTFNPSLIEQELVRVLAAEATSIQFLSNHMPATAIQLVQRIAHVSGKVIFSGSGKSGLVGQKLASTFASLGTPAFFLHPNDALHGDLGMIQADDLFIALSKSGTGVELEHIFRFLHSNNLPATLWCCDLGVLSRKADLVVQLPFDQEACHMGLAPSSSSTLMLAFGDAVAIAVSKCKNFDKHDFARVHPAGALGKKLLLTVQALMYSESALPLIKPNDSFQDLLLTITAKKLGVGIVVDATQKLLGIITDGDLRRACKQGPAVFEQTALAIMTMNPKTISSDRPAQDALMIMEDSNITSLVIVDNDKVCGLVHLHDLIKAGLKGTA
ncbi:KpsF/GutQ family sugar-phosphate isomerase [Candidatus Babeliales bacterium]|nr:KpsF/GutQ family sugar-phosphate isomerase [Candidatus Babeliales bacterium]